MASPLLAAIFAALLLCGVSACASEEGTTPDCNRDIDGNGAIDNEESCNPFAVCVVNGDVKAPAECCKDLQGFERDACLYGYGVEVNQGQGGGGGSGGGSGGGN
ncbi:hypothetical protein [Polyangium spumosum]|uniref:Kazal-like domain-containing protein n=1 Tax=Polyangium spumosum TaxID=889282 RepID=A0A6N7PUM3_9BACT|nr:hypothetical protein [Polyangium spumosum]MRG94120.1 hypothetical protein [Polyangium spumosum]